MLLVAGDIVFRTGDVIFSFRRIVSNERLIQKNESAFRQNESAIRSRRIGGGFFAVFERVGVSGDCYGRTMLKVLKKGAAVKPNGIFFRQTCGNILDNVMFFRTFAVSFSDD